MTSIKSNIDQILTLRFLFFVVLIGTTSCVNVLTDEELHGLQKLANANEEGGRFFEMAKKSLTPSVNSFPVSTQKRSEKNKEMAKVLILNELTNKLRQQDGNFKRFGDSADAEILNNLNAKNELLLETNKQLTKALDYATQSQIKGSYDFALIQKELEALKKARQSEEKLKLLADQQDNLGDKLRQKRQFHQEETDMTPANDGDLMQLANLVAQVGEKDHVGTDGECFPKGTPYANCTSVTKIFSLKLDSEASQLCDFHQLCTSCSSSYNIPAIACDKLFAKSADLLCSQENSPDVCSNEAQILLAAMQRMHVQADPIAAQLIGCQRRCTAELFTEVRKHV